MSGVNPKPHHVQRQSVEHRRHSQRIEVVAVRAFFIEELDDTEALSTSSASHSVPDAAFCEVEVQGFDDLEVSASCRSAQCSWEQPRRGDGADT